MKSQNMSPLHVVNAVHLFRVCQNYQLLCKKFTNSWFSDNNKKHGKGLPTTSKFSTTFCWKSWLWTLSVHWVHPSVYLFYGFMIYLGIQHLYNQYLGIVFFQLPFLCFDYIQTFHKKLDATFSKNLKNRLTFIESRWDTNKPYFWCKIVRRLPFLGVD